MPIVAVRLPDGTIAHVSIPEPALGKEQPGEMRPVRDFLSSVGSEVADRGKSVVKGAGSLLDFLGNMGLDMSGARGVPAAARPDQRAQLDQILPQEPIPQNPDFFDKTRAISRAGFEALPGAVLAGPQAGTAVLPSIVSGMTGETGRQLAEGVSPELGPYGQIAGALVGAGGMGMASAAARRPPISEVKNLQTDQGALSRMALDRIGPEVSPGDVANRASAGANALEGDIRRMGTGTWQGELAGAPSIPTRAITPVYQHLRNMANTAQTAVERDAFNQIADLFLDQSAGGGRFITNPDVLSSALKRYSQFRPTAGGAAFTPTDQAVRVARQAEDLLGNAYFPLARADRATAQFHDRVSRPLQESPIGSLADSNPNRSDPTSFGRLNTAISSTNPQGVEDLLRLLRNQGVSSQDIARAIAQQRLSAGSATPERAVFGNPSSPVEGNTSALLQNAGANSQAVRAPLELAETLARAANQKAPGMGEYLRMSTPVAPGGIRASISQKIGDFLRSNPEAKLAEVQLQALKAGASPAEMEILSRLNFGAPRQSPALPPSAAALIGAMQNRQGQ